MGKVAEMKIFMDTTNCSQIHVDEDESEAKQGNQVEHCCQRVIGARHS